MKPVTSGTQDNKNSFKKILQKNQKESASNEFLVSHDFLKLFTNIPLNEARNIHVDQRFEKNQSFKTIKPDL